MRPLSSINHLLLRRIPVCKRPFSVLLVNSKSPFPAQLQVPRALLHRPQHPARPCLARPSNPQGPRFKVAAQPPPLPHPGSGLLKRRHTPRGSRLRPQRWLHLEKTDRERLNHFPRIRSSLSFPGDNTERTGHREPGGKAVNGPMLSDPAEPHTNLQVTCLVLMVAGLPGRGRAATSRSHRSLPLLPPPRSLGPAPPP